MVLADGGTCAGPLTSCPGHRTAVATGQPELLLPGLPPWQKDYWFIGADSLAGPGVGRHMFI